MLVNHFRKPMQIGLIPGLPQLLGFVVWHCLLLLYAVLLLQDVFACTVRVAHVYMCVGRGTDPQIGLGQ